MGTGFSRRRIAGDVRLVAAGLFNPRGCYGSKIALLIGVGYPLGPIDIIPNSLPVIGYLDQLVFVLGGPALAYLLLACPARRRGAAAAGSPHRGAAAAGSPHRGAAAAGSPHRGAAAAGSPRGIAGPALATRAFATWGRAWLLDGFAAVFAVPMLRLATGSWPQKAEIASFRYAFRRFTPLPPLMRALASVPSGREQLTRAMLASWMLADEAYRGRLAQDLAGDDRRTGNSLRIWTGPAVTFLHIEKTAGMAMVAALAGRFHPLQIDADVRRAHPPHLFCHLPPFLLTQVRRRALVWGHYDIPSIDRLGRGRFTFTMLREPRARIRSLYAYWRAQAALDLGWNGMNQPVLLAQRLDFDVFLQLEDPMVLNYIDNVYVRRLTGQYATGAGDTLADDPDRWLRLALDRLARLDFVGLTEDTDGALARLGAMLDFVPPRHVTRVNVTQAAVSADAAADAALERLTAFDRIVYAAAVARYEATAGSTQ